MRSDLQAPADSTLANGDATVTLYRSGTPLDLIRGTAGDALDLTPYVQGGTQTDADANLELRHRTELAGANRPQPGQLVQIKRGDVVLWNGIMGPVSKDREAAGERSMSVTVRRRDAMPWWRDVHRVSSLFGVGADLGAMARDVAEALGLSDEEYELPSLGVRLAHDSAQLADVTAWEMLTTILQPALREPFVDALGRLKSVSRDTRRPPDLDLSWAQIASLELSGAEAPATSIKVRWLDPSLSKVPQQEQALATTSLMCGVFKPHQEREVWWSDDHRQRAEHTTMVVKQSINGMLPVGSETYKETSEFGGLVETQLGPWVPVISLTSLAGLLAASKIPDDVVVAGFGGSSGVTIPVGRVTQQIALNVLLLSLMSLGHGVYEIRGIPFDYVHGVNETEAYDQDAPAYVEKPDVVENDLVPDDATARSLAVNELIYSAKSATSRSVLGIADDPRIEKGDILGVPDGRRFMVTGCSRPVGRGADPLLTTEGFWL